jgi:hypothetical protein
MFNVRIRGCENALVRTIRLETWESEFVTSRVDGSIGVHDGSGLDGHRKSQERMVLFGRTGACGGPSLKPSDIRFGIHKVLYIAATLRILPCKVTTVNP